MQCKSQPVFLKNKPIKISDVWEVRLAAPLWRRICAASQKYGVSYSEISRYCIFRLAEKGAGLRVERFRNGLAQLKQTHRKEAQLHRHIVCFYGEDIRLVRLAALEMGISVSMFIRLAVSLFLPRLEMEIHSSKAVTAYELFWRGIKRWLRVELIKINNLGLPTYRHFTFSSFPPGNWWGRGLSDHSVAFSF